ncbi:HpaII family restriction endonuclease [Maribacter litoralis]|uniref:HpaII family restriction endonuclease n=1 Tax=Maribacter litoralis TaxID=2059726 RepID=UPI003D2A9944
MIKGNSGEWSEVYALLKILSDKELYAGNSNLQKIVNVVYPVIEIIRNEKSSTLHFSYKNGNVEIVKSDGNNYVIPIANFTNHALTLLTEIKNQKKKKGTFAVPTIEAFINSFGANSIKAQSTVKSDIIIKIHDPRTNIEPTLGFSIKSELGGDPTIMNASQTTNFNYKIKGVTLSSSEIKYINSIDTKSKIQDRIARINHLGGKLELIGAMKQVFENNLVLIDSMLPQILGNSLKYYFSAKAKKISDVVKLLSADNPCNFDMSLNHNFYEYKLKRLLMEVALGMLPKTVWTGQYDVTGGYLVVKESGDIICYHIYNKYDFENYLYNNTRFETSSSTRNKFGTIYIAGGEQYFNLNAQIRFI